MGVWINFRELRERLDTAQVLAGYGIAVKVKGDQAQGFCPLPNHPQHEGKRKSPSFSINLKRGIWQCFSCHSSGNLIDLACRMEGMNPDDPADIRKAALLLDERFPNGEKQPSPSLSVSRATTVRAHAHQDSAPDAVADAPEKPAVKKEVIMNTPLDFVLKHLDPTHPYLLNRGFTLQTIQRFGLGFCSRGLMKDRLVIPLHDAAGKLIGYAGRVVDDALINEENPRYRFPSGRQKDGGLHEFHKSLFLYNGHAVGDELNELIVVESFTAVWWLTQHGMDNVVAVMGSSCSTEQGTFIAAMTQPDALITLLTDGDEAGAQCAQNLFVQVAPHRAVRWARLDLGKQPTDLSAEDLADLLARI